MGKTSAAPRGTSQHGAKEGSTAPLGSKGGAPREQDAGVPIVQLPAPSPTFSPHNTLSRGRSWGWSQDRGHVPAHSACADAA